MTILRTVAAVLIGYLVYAFASMTLVGAIAGAKGAGAVVGGLLALAVIGALAGAVSGVIAGPKAGLAASITAALVILATLANLLMQFGAEPLWYKLGTLLLTAPMICLVGSRLARRASG